jgi:hypothetical protein
MSREEHLTEIVRQGQALRQEDIDLGAKQERERINGIIDQFIENSDYPEVASSLEWLQDVIKGEK